MRERSFDKFAVETAIVPDVVAERIVREAAKILKKFGAQPGTRVELYDFLTPRSGIFRDESEPVSFLVRHLISVYEHNKRFKSAALSAKGLDYVESYMRHWLSAEMIRRTKSSLVRAYLTELTNFANGEPFEG